MMHDDASLIESNRGTWKCINNRAPARKFALSRCTSARRERSARTAFSQGCPQTPPEQGDVPIEPRRCRPEGRPWVSCW